MKKEITFSIEKISFSRLGLLFNFEHVIAGWAFEFN